LLLRAGGAVEGGRRGIEIGDIELLKGLKTVRESYRVLIRFLIASGFKERFNESLKTANT
jgi:hypothetical protein